MFFFSKCKICFKYTFVVFLQGIYFKKKKKLRKTKHDKVVKFMIFLFIFNRNIKLQQKDKNYKE